MLMSRRAAAVGVPTVALFHSTKARSYAPRGPLHRAVQGEGESGIESLRGAVGEALARAGVVAATAMEGPSTPCTPTT